MSKYTSLPDIDTAPDIFETADEPEDVLRPSDDILKPADDEPTIRQTTEGIDEAGLPSRGKAGRAFMRYRRRDPKLEYYASDSSEPDRPIQAESTAARLRRLKVELAEVERDLQRASDPAVRSAPGAPDDADRRKSVLPPREAPDLWKELGGLRERMEGVELGLGSADARRAAESGRDWGQKLERLKRRQAEVDVRTASAASGSSSGRATDSNAAAAAGLSDIDKRLALLEALIGPSDVSSDTPSGSIQSTVSRLDHMLALLSQPRQLDAISRRVKLLLVDLDRAAAASRRAGVHPASSISAAAGTAGASGSPGSAQANGDKVTLSPADHAALVALFPLLSRLDPLLPILPALLNRLRSLAVLHAEAAGVADGLRRLQVEDRRTADELRDLKGVTDGIQKGLDGALEGVSKNWEVVEQRMRELEERLAKLQG